MKIKFYNNYTEYGNDEIVYIAGDNHRIEKQDSFEEF